MESENRLKYIIIVYILFIYTTLPVMRPLINFLNELLGRGGFVLGVNLLLILPFLGLLSYLFFKKKYFELSLVTLVFIIGAFVAMQCENPEERIHFLQYGILGYLGLKAVLNHRNHPVVFSFLLTSAVGVGDEVIQGILPNRVGDIKDVFMNCFGGLLGVIIGFLLNENKV